MGLVTDWPVVAGSSDRNCATAGLLLVTVTTNGGPPVRTFWIGHTLPRGSTVASVELDGRRVNGFQARQTNRGLEVRVAADPGRRHALVVTAA